LTNEKQCQLKLSLCAAVQEYSRPPVRERNPPWSVPVPSEEEPRWQGMAVDGVVIDHAERGARVRELILGDAPARPRSSPAHPRLIPAHPRSSPARPRSSLAHPSSSQLIPAHPRIGPQSSPLIPSSSPIIPDHPRLILDHPRLIPGCMIGDEPGIGTRPQ